MEPPHDSLPISLNLSLSSQSAGLLIEFIHEAISSSLKKALDQLPATPPLQTEQEETVRSLITSTPGTEVTPFDKAKAADLRTAVLLGKVPEETGLMIDAKTFARLLAVSSRHLNRLLDLKAVPEPIRLGRLLRWQLAEVLEWIEADCPPQRVWTSKRRSGPRKKGT